MKFKSTFLAGITAGLTVISSANAAVIFNDTFSSGTAAAAGYYRFGTTNTTLGPNPLVGTLDYTYASGASNRSGVIKSFSEQTLNVGDSITFSFDITSRTLANNENHSFRWAIGNLGNPTSVTGVPVTADLASATPFGSGTRQMYQFSASTGTTAGFGQFAAGSSSPVHAGGTTTAISGFSGPASVATSGATSVSLTITRTDTNDYSFSQTAFSTTSSGTLTGLGTNIFNNIAFSFNNNGAYSVSLDNVQVSVVPEPSTWALLAGGLTVLVTLRRRRHF